MSDIQRYATSEMYNTRETCMGKQYDGEWVKYSDHKQEMEFKDKKIKLLENNCHAVFEQSHDLQKEIERLKEFIKPITEIGEPVKDGYFNMYVQYDFVQEAKELIK